MLFLNPVIKKGKYKVSKQSQRALTIRAESAVKAREIASKRFQEEDPLMLSCICIEAPVRKY